MIEIDYNGLKQEIEAIFTRNKEIVLSTCVENKVTSRTISYIYMEQCFYFLTHARSMKYKQIQQNSQVSLCLYNIQITGQAFIKGHPLMENNYIIGAAFNEIHPDFFARFAHLKNAVFVEVRISDIKMWKPENQKDYFYGLDMTKKKAVRRG